MNEVEFGAQVRRARLMVDLTQVEVASAANISVVTLSNLESGKGSTLATVLKVLGVLGREDWLESLEPRLEFSPIRLSREAEGRREPQRATRRLSTRS